jgi:hypothetical protein
MPRPKVEVTGTPRVFVQGKRQFVLKAVNC